MNLYKDKDAFAFRHFDSGCARLPTTPHSLFRLRDHIALDIRVFYFLFYSLAQHPSVSFPFITCTIWIITSPRSFVRSAFVGAFDHFCSFRFVGGVQFESCTCRLTDWDYAKRKNVTDTSPRLPPIEIQHSIILWQVEEWRKTIDRRLQSFHKPQKKIKRDNIRGFGELNNPKSRSMISFIPVQMSFFREIDWLISSSSTAS